MVLGEQGQSCYSSRPTLRCDGAGSDLGYLVEDCDRTEHICGRLECNGWIGEGVHTVVTSLRTGLITFLGEFA